MQIIYENVPKRARTRMAVERAAEFVLEYGIRTLPVSAREIIRREGWILHSYGYLAKKYNPAATIAEICELLGSTDAATFVNDYGVPVICYNETVLTAERIEWSLLHEVGHLKLGHFQRFDMFRLTDAERKTLDIEADTWAANVRAPICIVDQLKKPLRQDYRLIFGLSKEGWAVRHRTAARDRRALSPELAEALVDQFADYMHDCICQTCATHFLGDAGTDCACPVCGGKDIKWAHWDDVRKVKPLPVKSFMMRACDIPAPAPRKHRETRSSAGYSYSPRSSWASIFREGRFVSDRYVDPEIIDYYMTENPMVIDSLWER